MKITPDVIRHEFVGTYARVVKSRHPGYLGLSGQVINETRNTFTLLDKGNSRNIIKDSVVFQFKLQDGTIVEIIGKLLMGRPEGRLKKTIKRLW